MILDTLGRCLEKRSSAEEDETFQGPNKRYSIWTLITSKRFRPRDLIFTSFLLHNLFIGRELINRNTSVGNNNNHRKLYREIFCVMTSEILS